MSTQNSPVTGILDESHVVLDFGKYEGRTIRDVSEIDPDFYQALANDRESGRFAIRRHRDKTFRLFLNPGSTRDH
ncbi:MAG: hypothetical protein IT285_04350 [Bdellovibrionales bacterium]|nr:hypothetical protein [Bdellovibrionales bacterium]